MVIGVDIGGTCVKIAALRDGQALWVGQSRHYARPSFDVLISAIREARSGPMDQVEAVGLCVPGLLDAREQRVKLSVNVPGIVGADLEQLLAQGLDQPAGRMRVVSDAVASAFDVHISRQLQGRLLVMALGTGVGAAVLDDGVPLRVDEDSPGHWGQVDVSIAGEEVIGPDGGVGGLEGYVGLSALRSRYGEDIETALAGLKGNEAPIRALARAIRIAHAIYRPMHVYLVGGIGIRLGHLLPALREQVQAGLTRIARPGWMLSTGDDAFHAARGAARLAAADLRSPGSPAAR